MDDPIATAPVTDTAGRVSLNDKPVARYSQGRSNRSLDASGPARPLREMFWLGELLKDNGGDRISNKLTVFRCLSCGEFIGTDAQRCRFCSAPVNRQAAETASEVQQKVNAAYDDANQLKWIALSVLGFYAVTYVSLIVNTPERLRAFLLTPTGDALSVLAPAGLCALAIIVVILRIVRWRSKYSGFQTDNPDMNEAKAAARGAFIAWCLLCVTWIAIGLIPILLRLKRRM
ncbi:MAG: hypothetical protein ACXWID_04930 [Pyrinomonadaceae bacterium]